MIKEFKLRPKIDDPELKQKIKHIRKSLLDGKSVLVTVMFRGREVSHPELGTRILIQIRDTVDTLGNGALTGMNPDGRSMGLLIHPKKGKGDPAGVFAKVK